MSRIDLSGCQPVSLEHENDPSSEALLCFAAALHLMAEERVAMAFGSQVAKMNPKYQQVLCLTAVREELLTMKRSMIQAPQNMLSNRLLSVVAQAEAGVNTRLDTLFPPETEDEMRLAKFIVILRETIKAGK